MPWVGGLFKAATIIAVASVVSKVLGFAREVSLAATFGATYATDAYLVSQTIPVLLFAAVGSALSTTFIPVYSKTRQERGQAAAFDVANSIINSTMVLSLVVVALGELQSGPLTRAVAPGFRDATYRLTVELSQVMFLMIPLQAVSGLLAAVLQAEGQFVGPAVAGLSFNPVVIGSILGFGARLGIRAVAVGTLVAVGVQTVLMLPWLRAIGYKWRPILNLREPGLVRIAQLAVPVFIGTSVNQLNTFIDRMLASGLDAGSVASLGYANRLIGLVPGILGTAIITVLYPTLSRMAARGDWREFRDSLTQAISILIFVLVPVATAIAVLRTPVVQLAFQRGAFDAKATEETAWAMLFFSPSVAFGTLSSMASRALFALEDTLIPVILGSVSLLINIVFNLVLVHPLRQGGLALATSISAAFSAVALIRMADRAVGTKSEGAFRGVMISDVVATLGRVLVASLASGLVIGILYRQLTLAIPYSNLMGQTIRLTASAGPGAVVYLLVCLTLGVPEARGILVLAVGLWRRLRRP